MGHLQPLFLGASVTGPSHQRTGERGQDALRWSELAGGGLVVAVADGAGSALLGDLGARVAAEAAVGAVRLAWPSSLELGGQPEQLQPDLRNICRSGVEAAARAVREEAGAELTVSLRDLASTLLVVVWYDGRAAAAHVGDGGVVGWRREEPGRGIWEVISAPAPTEYVNETRFLTDPDWESALRISAERQGIAALVAFSDGCQRAALRRRRVHEEARTGKPEGDWEPFTPFLDPLLRFAASGPDPGSGSAELARLLDSAKLRSTSDDDKTLAVIYCALAGADGLG